MSHVDPLFSDDVVSFCGRNFCWWACLVFKTNAKNFFFEKNKGQECVCYQKNFGCLSIFTTRATAFFSKTMVYLSERKHPKLKASKSSFTIFKQYFCENPSKLVSLADFVSQKKGRHFTTYFSKGNFRRKKKMSDFGYAPL